MKRKAITSDDRRTRLLSRVQDTSGLKTQYGATLVPPELVAGSHDLLPVFEEAISDVAVQFGLRRAVVARCDSVLEEVHREVSNFQAGLQLQGRILSLGPDYLGIFRRPTDRRGARVTETRHWLSLAKKLIKDEAVAVGLGHPPMTAPSVERLTQLVPNAHQICLKADEANHNYMKALADLESFRAEVDVLIGDVASYLEYALRRFQPSRRRQIMRSYVAGMRPPAHQIWRPHDGGDTR